MASEHTDTWYYCIECKDKAYKSSCDHVKHNNHEYLTIQGVLIIPEFISNAEEVHIVNEIDKIPWVDSQSGRRKQDFGPKVNFKKKKLKLGSFTGFPEHSKVLLERMKEVEALSDFLPVEMCNLEYEPLKGASIDPHFDDFWLWGDRLVTFNLLSNTSYTLTQTDSPNEIILPLPARCLAVIYGDARNKWMHSIARHHISSRRIGITVRELTPQFLEGGSSESLGKELLATAAQTWMPPLQIIRTT
ncbi:alpha-ketoglutarate-dependent dioxygenase alkB homolog 4-like isoform X2 [Watersipora subatra]|uniref:alpha-ketoglutarate-dependent dioxygenase alkB homolog 4-like isoform X2 n=1 Tax=Watersipora subatra TaxID=2589382 RepID=UPI00355B5F59